MGEMPVFKHYKGGLYRYLGRVIQESDGASMASYRSLENNVVYVRPEHEFFGMVAVGGKEVKRFQLREGEVP